MEKYLQVWALMGATLMTKEDTKNRIIDRQEKVKLYIIYWKDETQGDHTIQPTVLKTDYCLEDRLWQYLHRKGR